MSKSKIEIQISGSLADISAEDWDSCACPEAADGRPFDPFTTHRFLKALEDSGSVGAGTGWSPRYLVALKDDRPIGVAPLYVKSSSHGEYVFDWGWADAYERAGGRYYPKLQIAVPFTPATGRRFLTKPGYDLEAMSALMQGALHIASENGLSSLHVTFCTEAEALAGEEIGLIHRVGQQFHWNNQKYANFESFTDSLSSRKRKNVRKERFTAQCFGGNIRQFTGNQIKPEHWDAFWQFYQDTGARKWGTPYLTRAFFDEAQAHLRDDILLVMAEREGRFVAGALNFIGRDTLFGRYWGCTEHHPCLHFELCYYQAIEAAIEMGLSRVEAGAQGEHKLARGYMPTITHSLHWIADPNFRDAVARFVASEREAVDEDVEILTTYGPFKNTRQEDHD